MTASTERLTLPNGLQVSLCHAPRLKRCAASLRVAAGSHDVPPAWPGLAHFLEHLFFLGTERFPADEKLMTFVQRHGGQVNARTSERTTDFFFELPQPAFAQGLERLCEMLVHPRLTTADQLREREVLHAEFIAWSRDAESRYQLDVLAQVSALHPLRAFHAGNRYSLPVPRPSFQQALRDFYQHFYQAGQISLSLVGPQSLAELKAMAVACGALFPSGARVEQQPPPRLLEHAAELQPVIAPRRLSLLLACEDLPDGNEEAIAFVCHWLNTSQPGSLLAGLRERGLIDSLKAHTMYAFAGQALIHVELRVVGPGAIGMVSRLFFNWLCFFKTHWPSLRDEYQLLQQRRLDTASALDLAHHFARDTPAGLSESGAVAVAALLDQLQPLTKPAEPIDWPLPKPNPFLTSSPETGEGAIYLRWHLQAPHPTLWQMLDARLQPLYDEARQAGVNLGFSAYGDFWQLKLTGLLGPMPAIVEHALGLLSHPDLGVRPGNEPKLIPIRQLLKVLPDRFLTCKDAPPTKDISAFWAATRWSWFTTGLPDAGEKIPNDIPGQPEDQPPAPHIQPGKRWVTEVSDSSENALLLFCPAPSLSVADEAAWRLLTHLAQAPFYQRLRVELQLGYAVFSGFRQIAGQSGLLFGVQSPDTFVEDLIQHIERFIAHLPELIDNAHLPEQIHALSAQLDPQAMDSAQLAETLWQAHLAGHEANYINDLNNAILSLKSDRLQEAARQLDQASGGRLYLSNRSEPATPAPPRP